MCKGRPINDLSGKRFNKLLVVKRGGLTKSGNILWKCQCDCGNESLVSTDALVKSSTVSCGCYKRKRVTTHGLSGSNLYDVWCAMRQRCNSKTSKDYKWYGAKGVSICNEWDDYKIFAEWATTSGYAKGLTIDRINSEGNYSPLNCRWIPLSEQNANKRPTIKWRHGTMTGYALHKCRCADCKTANATASRNSRAQRRLKAEALAKGN